MSPLRVSTIIVSYNTAKLTTQAIESVLDNYLQDKIAGEIIVVDNNSSDDSVKILKNHFGKKIVLIDNAKNFGFAHANNQGIDLSRGEFLFLLNSDTILKPHAIRQLLRKFSQYPNQDTAQLAHTPQRIDRLGIVSGQLLNPDGSIQVQGGALPTLLNLAVWWLWPLPGSLNFLPAALQYHQENPTYFHTERPTGWVAGTAMMLRKAVIEEIGELDEDIFMYAEDVEFCWRARMHHWDVLYTPESQIIHYGSASSSNANALRREIAGLHYITAKHLPPSSSEVIQRVLQLGAAMRWMLFGIILSDAEKKKLYAQILQDLQDHTGAIQ